MTHEGCLQALLTVLTDADKSEGGRRPVAELCIPEGVNAGARCGNTGIAILKIRWERVDGVGRERDDQVDRKSRGQVKRRLEARASKDHPEADCEEAWRVGLVWYGN